MSDLVGTLKCQFSHAQVQIKLRLSGWFNQILLCSVDRSYNFLVFIFKQTLKGKQTNKHWKNNQANKKEEKGIFHLNCYMDISHCMIFISIKVLIIMDTVKSVFVLTKRILIIFLLDTARISWDQQQLIHWKSCLKVRHKPSCTTAICWLVASTIFAQPHYNMPRYSGVLNITRPCHGSPNNNFAI